MTFLSPDTLVNGKSSARHSLTAVFNLFGRKPKNRRRRPAGLKGSSLSFECLERRELMATFAVTSTADSGAGTLRWAIEQANASTGADTVSFDIRNNGLYAFEDVDARLAGGDRAADVFVIRPLTALPALTDTTGGTWINGRSQTTARGNLNPFGPEVVIDGSQTVGDPVNGLQIWIGANSNRVDGLVIQNFNGQGISIVRSDDNVIAGNYIGTDATGTQPRGNGQTMRASAGGILLSAGAERNLIGTNADGVDDAAERNVISGNYRHGIRVQQGSLDDITQGNIIRGNYIGTDATGKVVEGLGNRTYAVEYFSHTTDGVRDNIVTGNIIAGNVGADVYYAGISPDRNLWVGNVADPINIFSNGPVTLPVNNPATGIPPLNSLAPSEINRDTKTIYLDFDGHREYFWQTVQERRFLGIVVGRVQIGTDANNDAFTIDDSSAFSQTELNIIQDIHRRISEDFAPFNVNVTTVEPARFERGRTIRVAFGRSNDWELSYRRFAGELNPDKRSGFDVGRSTVFVFSDFVNSVSAVDYIIAACNATTASHEAGHAFRLAHQSALVNGTFVEYSYGDNFKTPIMGANLSDDRTIWWSGRTPAAFGQSNPGDPTWQSDLHILAQTIGYRRDDHSSGFANATRLNNLTPTTVPGGPFSALPKYQAAQSGIIERMDDWDVFSFYHEGGNISIRVDPLLGTAVNGANLDARVELRDSTNRLVATSHAQEQVFANPDFPSTSDSVRWIDPHETLQSLGWPENLSAAIPYPSFSHFGLPQQVNLPPGTYYVVVMSEGGYGDLGRYNLQVSGITRAPRFDGGVLYASASQLNPVSNVDMGVSSATLALETRNRLPITHSVERKGLSRVPYSDPQVPVVSDSGRHVSDAVFANLVKFSRIEGSLQIVWDSLRSIMQSQTDLLS
jgi:parallel beta-helix repeat protein